jgi:hypothetical protein
VREDGRIVGGKGWQEKEHNREERRNSWEEQGIVTFCTCQWNEWMNEWMNEFFDISFTCFLLVSVYKQKTTNSSSKFSQPTVPLHLIFITLIWSFSEKYSEIKAQESSQCGLGTDK